MLVALPLAALLGGAGDDACDTYAVTLATVLALALLLWLSTADLVELCGAHNVNIDLYILPNGVVRKRRSYFAQVNM